MPRSPSEQVADDRDRGLDSHGSNEPQLAAGCGICALTDLAHGMGAAPDRDVRGHRNTRTTLQCIHLYGRELAAKLEGAMAQTHSARIRQFSEVLS